MKVSYNWLQTYFKEPLPTPEKLAELFTFRFAEVESIDATPADTILDVKILPDRAHYALCHKGIAMEVAAITGASIIIPAFVPEIKIENAVPIRIENESLCHRYTARYIENVTVGVSPAWLTDRLGSIGQRSINAIVDTANFIMFDMGQPLHAFDADKVRGTIVVRMARDSEKITTLDGKEVTLSPKILVIADDEGALAIAGIKGGTRAQVDERTSRIILESAHFDPVYIRAASALVGIRTDASKRYENEITPEWASVGSDLCAALVAEICPGSSVGILSDVYPVKAEVRTMEFDPAFASSVLGQTIEAVEIIRILSSLGIHTTLDGANLILAIPSERLDLVLPEDIVEEIGRIYGYENIPPVFPPKLGHDLPILKRFYYEEKIRDVLVGLGFSEIITYSFRDIGFVEIEKSLASDKNFLRGNLTSNMEEELSRNARNADLLGLDDIKMFEIGTAFDASGEYRALSIGVKKLKKQKDITAVSILKDTFGKIEMNLGLSDLNVETVLIPSADTAVWQTKIGTLFASLPEPTSWNNVPYKQENITYKKISPYPFMVRDIAMFVPVETKQDDIAELLKIEAGELLANLRLFDIFTKTFPDGSQKTSYGFRLVFQSYEKTLSDEEANAIMTRINAAVSARGWEVR